MKPTERARQYQIAMIQMNYLQLTDHQLSKKLGVSLDTVIRIRQQYGLKRGKWTDSKLAARFPDELDPSQGNGPEIDLTDPEFND